MSADTLPSSLCLSCSLWPASRHCFPALVSYYCSHNSDLLVKWVRSHMIAVMNKYPIITLFHWDSIERCEIPNGMKSQSHFRTLLSCLRLPWHWICISRVCLAESVLQYFSTPLRVGFKDSAPASVRAGLLISPHTQTWAAASSMTHVAPEDVHFNSALARGADQAGL